MTMKVGVLQFFSWPGRHGPLEEVYARALEKLHQRGAILLRADALLRHLGAGRIGLRSDLEQFGNRLRRPDDIEPLERFDQLLDVLVALQEVARILKPCARLAFTSRCIR